MPKRDLFPKSCAPSVFGKESDTVCAKVCVQIVKAMHREKGSVKTDSSSSEKFISTESVNERSLHHGKRICRWHRAECRRPCSGTQCPVTAQLHLVWRDSFPRACTGHARVWKRIGIQIGNVICGEAAVTSVPRPGSRNGPQASVATTQLQGCPSAKWRVTPVAWRLYTLFRGPAPGTAHGHQRS